MADISTGRQRGIVPFVDETTGRLPDQYIPQKIIDLQGDLEQAVTNASSSATAASQSASQAQSSATAADSSAQAASTSSESARTASDSATSSKNAAAQSASQASASASAAQQAVDGFGLEAGTTTTGQPGSDAAVNITKQGTKYVADFTIPQGTGGQQGPKGDPGDLTTVAHDATLTGDGTANNVLKISKGFYPDPIDINPTSKLNDLTNTGFYRVTNFNSDDSPLPNLPIGGFVVVNHVGSSLFQSLTVVWRTFDTAEIYIRAKIGPGPWTNWRKIASADDLSSYVPLSTYQALEARVQALEAKLSNQ